MTPKIIVPYKDNKTRVGYNFVSFLDLTLNEAKGVGTLSHLLWLVGYVYICQHSYARLNLKSDWSTGLHGQFKPVYDGTKAGISLAGLPIIRHRI